MSFLNELIISVTKNQFLKNKDGILYVEIEIIIQRLKFPAQRNPGPLADQKTTKSGFGSDFVSEDLKQVRNIFYSVVVEIGIKEKGQKWA